MKVLLAGEGAIARKHAHAMARIKGVEIAGLVGGELDGTRRFAEDHDIPWWSLDLDEALTDDDIDAVVVATPTPLHADQTIRCLRAGKHTLVEIPMADNLADSEAVVRAADESDRVAMVCHTRRFNPSHQWIHRRLRAGELRLQHLVVETLFLRRDNRNALGQPRSWTDHLLWHHACHTVDLFGHQSQEPVERMWALQGPPHPDLGIAMDMTVGLATPTGSLCTLALSFNNDGPLGTTFRYICDNGTYLARYDELTDGYGEPVDVTADEPTNEGIELQDREFFSAIAAGREPEASVRQCLPAMQTLDRLQATLGPGPHTKS